MHNMKIVMMTILNTDPLTLIINITFLFESTDVVVHMGCKIISSTHSLMHGDDDGLMPICSQKYSKWLTDMTKYDRFNVRSFLCSTHDILLNFCKKCLTVRYKLNFCDSKFYYPWPFINTHIWLVRWSSI